MLYHLCLYLKEEFSALNVFRYLTFRSMVGFLITLTSVLVFQPKFIRYIKFKAFGQPIRDDGPQSHLTKSGTPTMGGVVWIISAVVATLLLADLTNLYVWVTVLLTLCYAALGFLDDYRKVVKKNPKGVSAGLKMKWQIIGALLAVLALKLGGLSTAITIPYTKEMVIDLGWLFIPFGVVVIVGASNAVNLTDGLDGLVTGPVMTVATAYGIFAYVSGNAQISEYLKIQHVAGAGDLSIFAASILAGGLGFLWFNSFPAQVFMGDVGALALGGALGVLSLITKQELILLVAGGVFVVEALSVILQVASFKLTGRRIFKMAPIHHHFELAGLSEPKIIVRAWIISLVLAVLAISSLKLR
jgi:phospho-N-acetylmuramoyl-pentapeptide-transferase